MPSHTSSRRRRRAIEDDDSELRSDASEAPKRPRLSRGASDSEDDDDHEIPNRSRTNGVNSTARGDEGGFSPGAIRRVKVENFVTYELAEFFPGPNLNMVIGPNGTGKSSLVCAICLGLGFSPKHLGRAGNVKEFVKHGKPSAVIEIELQRRPEDRSHHVIRVQIDRERNSQKWWLNGKDSSHKTIQGLMRDLKIQVDNLCQFLPQDRVVEFASATPIDLLHETLRAAAPQQMLDWQRSLQDLHKDRKELQRGTDSAGDHLKQLEDRQNYMQHDVDRLREREEAQQKIVDLTDARAVADYLESKALYKEKRQQEKLAQKNLRKLEHESAPSLQAVNRKQEYHEKVAAVVRSRKDTLRRTEAAADTSLSRIEDVDEQVKTIEGNIESSKKGFEVKKQELGKIRSKIGLLENQKKNKPAEFNATEHNTQIREKEHQLRELEAESRQAEGKLRDIKEQGHAKTQMKQTLNRELEGLHSQQGQMFNFIQKKWPDVAKGYTWLQENADKFEKEVFGPPALCCSVKDDRYSDQIQALLHNDDFLCFTAQTRDDHKKLSHYLYKVMSLSVNVRSILKPLHEFRPKMSRDEANALGLDAFALDMITGPEPVLAMLCNEKKIDASGIALKDINDAQYDRIVQGEVINNWSTGRQLYRVSRRKDLGPGAVSTMTRGIQQGMFWTDQPVDEAEKSEIKRKISEVEAEFDALKAQNTEVRGQMAGFNDRRNEIHEDLKLLKERKNELQRAHNAYQGIPVKLESEKRALDQKKAEVEEARTAIQQLGFDLDKAMLSKAKTTLQHHAAIAGVRAAQEALLEAQIREIEAKSDVQGLKARNNELVQMLEDEKRNIAALTQDSQRTRQRAEDAQSKVIEIFAQDETRKDLLEALARNKSVEDVDNEIAAEQHTIEQIHVANPGALREFEMRAREIEKLRSKMESSTTKLDHLNRQITKIREKWEPQLDELVGKINDAFSYNFEQINCAGEIRIHKDEDFDQWALDIMVKFRENETLQQLNQHRQSGGERAVSTIFYLLALQSMAQSPFRVVDEINQGMDPRNERMVHERMVEIACREHTSQYFLITPKLLTGLRYDPRMRVLCIASGTHMPKEGKKLDFARCLKRHKQITAGA
ncbi:RecF/RecN/SMC N terminal domain-containing protein [Colletotrichum orchidophilum]|uniref:Structural maintenance of chromosomes protein 5 n=1 Tax=Colletotrichum orchidophilum TaxID=1209926 RepID=A0A1G4B5B4_9PEZI|nr:RecF/RecN/SMC N terminal domain-containing protein [Colletotrichum orchidophilum]OHE96594.1 RecF/RecN/SMC N terminal domain-containing protein [Colletotrichum orchidophilum]